MNEYFQPGSVPAPSSPGSSAVMRQEFSSIAQGFDKLPVLAGHANEIVVVNASGTALVTSGAAIGDYVTKDGVFTLTNKTIAWADNTFPGFGTGATKNAGLLADNVLAGGAIIDPKSKSPTARAIRAFLDAVAATPDLRPIIVPLGDGCLMAVRN